MDYSEKIKSLRKAKGISQIEMAERTGISQAAYGKIETGFTKSITIDLGVRIAAALSVSFNELFEIGNTNSEVEKMRAELSSLHAVLKEKSDRIDEKDQVIKSYFYQVRQLKRSLILQIDNQILADYLKLRDKLKECTDSDEKRLIQNSIKRLRHLEDIEFDRLVKDGIFGEDDVEDYFEAEKELFKDPDYEPKGVVPYYILRDLEEKDKYNNFY